MNTKIDVAAIAAEEIKRMIAGGDLQEMIENQVRSTVTEQVRRAISKHSNFGEKLGQMIDGTLFTCLENVSLAEYNAIISQCITEQYSKTIGEEFSKSVNDWLIEKLVKVPKRLDIKELLNHYAKEWHSDTRDAGEYRIKTTWEKNDDTAIYLTIHHPEFNNRTIRISFYKFCKQKEFYIGYIDTGERIITNGVVGSTHALNHVIFVYQLYCYHTEITGFDDVYGLDIELKDD